MSRTLRAPLLLVLTVLAGFFVALGQSTPSAYAGEGPVTVKGNYVPLAKPTRLLNTTLGKNASANFTAVGVTNVPPYGHHGRGAHRLGEEHRHGVG